MSVLCVNVCKCANEISCFRKLHLVKVDKFARYSVISETGLKDENSKRQ